MRRLRPAPPELTQVRSLNGGSPRALPPQPGPAPRPRRSVRRVLRRAVAPTSLAIGVVLLTWSVLGATLTVYLPPDGAHYLADADALLGDGVRPLRHPPLFPALVGLTRAVVGDVSAFPVAMMLSLAVFAVSLYLLLRRWVSTGAAVLGASLGILFPTTAELLGWGGGATLLAVAGAIASVAAFEGWVDGRRWGGALTGAALAWTALTHPFVFAVAALCVGVRWISVLVSSRAFGAGWGPLGARGLASAAAVLAPAVTVAAPYYLSVGGGGGFSLEAPRPSGLADLLAWATASDALPWLLLAVAVVAVVASGQRGVVVVASTIGALTVVMATSLAAHPSYVTRVAYLFPIVVALGSGLAAEKASGWLDGHVRPASRRRALAIGMSVLVVAAMALLEYGPRAERSATFYRFVEMGDVRGIRALAGQPGVVATSWHLNEYGTGISASWFAEGLARRVAFGPTEPWLSTVPEQRAAGQDLQRLFAGTEGIENGAVQISAGPPGVRADPAIQVRSDGFYHPLLFGNVLVNDYPVEHDGTSTRRIEGAQIRWTMPNGDGDPAISQVVRLDGDDVRIELELAPGSEPGSWSVWFWPAYGVHWEDVEPGVGAVRAQMGLPEEDVAFSVRATGADVVYHPIEARFAVEAVEVRAEDVERLDIVIDVEAGTDPAELRAFDERQILTRYDITDVVVWKDAGWRERFDLSACYRLANETTGLRYYEVTAECT